MVINLHKTFNRRSKKMLIQNILQNVAVSLIDFISLNAMLT